MPGKGKTMKLMSVKEVAVLLVLASVLVVVATSAKVVLRKQDIERFELLISKREADKEAMKQIKIRYLQKKELKELRELRRRNRSVVARKPRRWKATSLIPIPETQLLSGGSD